MAVICRSVYSETMSSNRRSRNVFLAIEKPIPAVTTTVASAPVAVRSVLRSPFHSGTGVRIGLFLLAGLLLILLHAEKPVQASVPLPAPESNGALAQVAESTGKLVLVPDDLYVGETTVALGFHLDFPDRAITIGYSDHFVPEGEECDSAEGGTVAFTATPARIPLTACATGEGRVQLMETDTGIVIAEATATITQPDATASAAARSCHELTGVLCSPNAPTGLEALVLGQRDIAVTWDRLIGATEYKLEKVEVRFGGSTETFDVTATGKSFIVDAGTEHTFRVQAYGNGSTWAEEWGLWSTPVTVTTETPPTMSISVRSSSPSTITEGTSAQFTLRASHAPSFASLTINIDVTQDGEFLTSFRPSSVRLSRNSTTASLSLSTTDDSTCEDDGSVTVTIEEPDSTSYYTYNVGSPSSAEVAITDICPPPPPPTGLDANAAGTTSIDLTWDQKSGIDRYRVERALSSLGPWSILSSSVDDESYTATGLAADTRYWFRVSAYGDGATYAAEWSSPSSDSARTDPLPTPTGLDADAAGATSIDLTWDQISGIDRYRVERASSSSGPWTILSSSVDVESYTATGLTPNTRYWFRVSAYGDGTTYAAEWSSPSSSDSARTDPLPNRPPVFTDGTSATRSVAENTGVITNIGSAISATDADNDALTYSKSGTDAAFFGLSSSTGQLRTSAALNHETKSSYTFRMSVSDGRGGSDTISVTVNVIDMNEAPVFSNTVPTFDIHENIRTVANKFAEDEDSADSVTYALGGTDKDLFSISTAGDITFDSAPNFEQPGCGLNNNSNSCTITVTAIGGAGAREKTATQNLTVNVTDVNEAPEKPSAPTVTSGGETSLSVTWSAPSNTGPPINDYDVQYRVVDSGGQFTPDTHTDAATPKIISNLDPGTAYEVQVRAKNAEGTSSWSDSGTGSTDAGVNDPPTFDDGEMTTRSVPENTPSGTPFGSAVSASDDDGDTLRYSLGGTDADSFGIDSTSGQLRTSAPLNFETENSYSVTVSVSDGSLSDSIDVTVTVKDVNEPPVISGDDNVGYYENGTGSIRVYTATDDDGDPIIWSLPDTEFQTDNGDFIISVNGILRFASSPNYENPQGGEDDDANAYMVTVGASDGNLSDEINVTINVKDVNEPPVFSNTAPTFDIHENIRAVANKFAEDEDSADHVTYTLSGTDNDLFTIDAYGILAFRNAPNYENPLGGEDDDDNAYKITVKATGGTAGPPDRRLSASQDLTINVWDVNEPPGIPSAPTVTSNGETSLRVTWSAPPNTGPPINEYDVQYRVVDSGGQFTPDTHTDAATPKIISNLDPGTSYEVQVRAKNDEGMSDWSDSGTGSTDAAALPTVTIARHTNQSETVTEGDEVRFTLTADPAPTANLTVTVSIGDSLQGGYLTGDIPSTIEIAMKSGTADIILQTEDDSVDEADGIIVAFVKHGTGYLVGDPPSDSVTVLDNDSTPPPAVPTGLRANGDLNNSGEVTLRWQAVPGATGYNVRFVEEVCDSRSGVCKPDTDPDTYVEKWTEEPIIGDPINNRSTREATLGSLEMNTLYRVQLNAQKNVGPISDWSEPVFVYPTSSPFGWTTSVATAYFHGYQTQRANEEEGGDPEGESFIYLFVVCDDTITEEISNGDDLAIINDISSAVARWETTVIWDRNGDRIEGNIIRTIHDTLLPGQTCVTHKLESSPSYNHVRFSSEMQMWDACALRKREGNGCWRGPSWASIPLDSIEYGTTFLRADVGARWNTLNTIIGCTYLHRLVVHEAGHGFGIGSARVQHPTNTEHSIMSENDSNNYCEPQAYDIVALMALYQSR